MRRARRSTLGRWRAATAGLAVVAALWLAPWPRVSPAAEPAEHVEAFDELPITDDDREHWSFRPLVRPPLPAVRDVAWPHNPLDRFILARLEAKGAPPQPEADRGTLIRRVTLDLTGLPPSPAEVAGFVADESPDAYERLVERLLASPALGEHLAQNWLDLARWAETDGFEHDKVRPDAWRYRDWVIDAINGDLPYDDFVSLQLAGDELRPGDKSARIATGFCLSGPDMPDINSQDERRSDVLNELTATVGSVLLGLQLGCAQCHDHKYDPLSQLDFYRLRAVFEPAVDFSGSTFSEQLKHVRPSHLEVRGDFRRRGPEVEPAFPRIANPWNVAIEPPPPGAPSSLRRAQLARWLTRPDHPLTGRVMANRVWREHFGRGLSESPGDFGLLGDEPLHGELLDWLAVELADRGWSVKHLRRMIVTSATYRQASRPAAADDARWRQAVERDPHNRYWSRFPRRRLTGETVRDLLLSATGAVNLERHGEGVRPPLPPEVVQTLLQPAHWQVSEREADHYRRSIYVFARRNLRYPLFESFDRPAATTTCAARPRSTTALQSLLLFNGELSFEAARRLAGSALAAAPDDADEQIARCYWLALCREPSGEEFAEAAAFLAAQAAQLKAAGRTPDTLAAPLPAPPGGDPYHAAALVDFALALFNASEFVHLE